MIQTVGSVCSGIEAASVAWSSLPVRFEWFSEIAPFPSRVLSKHYSSIPNLGDMNQIPDLLAQRSIVAPDLICGGTPCQAFSLAGLKNGLDDERGNLTLKFVDIIDTNDQVRFSSGQSRCKVFWENVEGVLTDKTNAFGSLISSLAGLDNVLTVKNNRWPNAGILHGKKRNLAWRVLDAKFFGLPQQRRRLYVLAGGKDFFPENILFEPHTRPLEEYPNGHLTFQKDGHCFEIFRAYTDCLYSSYGTKWNGNAAAYNGSLFIVQDGRIRRLSPLESERLMGFPDNYTNLAGSKKTNRYQCIGNSWAVPVIRWLGNRLLQNSVLTLDSGSLCNYAIFLTKNEQFYNFGREDFVTLSNGTQLNCSSIPENPVFSSMQDIVSADAPQDIYLSPVGCFGIIRRKQERHLRINPRLEEILLSISSEMPFDEIEKKSRIQHRGRFSSLPSSLNAVASDAHLAFRNDSSQLSSIPKPRSPINQLSLFDFT